MSMHVLVGYDESPRAESALRHALKTYPDAEVTVLHVTDPSEWISGMDEDIFYSEEAFERSQETAEELLDGAEEIAAEYDREVARATTTGKPAGEVVAYAEEHEVDHIVVGSHGRTGLNRFLLGSVAERIVKKSPCPVTVIRGKRLDAADDAA
jgi:nucleotide-binding universal stress UspA family protein